MFVHLEFQSPCGLAEFTVMVYKDKHFEGEISHSLLHANIFISPDHGYEAPMLGATYMSMRSVGPQRWKDDRNSFRTGKYIRC
jgi:hypothetical protein